MSVVTRWRKMFSSSVTHSSSMPGFWAVKSSVRPCMRIMSPLLTVAIVNVCAAAADARRHVAAAAPIRALSLIFIAFSPCSQ